MLRYIINNIAHAVQCDPVSTTVTLIVFDVIALTLTFVLLHVHCLSGADDEVMTQGPPVLHVTRGV